eukprot:scaffold1056_cov96-Skeletonema_dohrnii-CCMP3373.AAC.4
MAMILIGQDLAVIVVEFSTLSSYVENIRLPGFIQCEDGDGAGAFTGDCSVFGSVLQSRVQAKAGCR